MKHNRTSLVSQQFIHNVKCLHLLYGVLARKLTVNLLDNIFFSPCSCFLRFQQTVQFQQTLISKTGRDGRDGTIGAKVGNFFV